ncbi:hypothetical protein HC928_10995 [bacterium]|nr:hypothetical protein [bacterium]
MGFLNWFKNQDEENVESSQLNLLSDNSQPVRRRTDGAAVRNDFTNTIKEKQGSGEAIARSTNKMTHNIFGCETEELYEQTGGRKNRRETLPKDAQDAYVVGEVAATHKLKATEIKGNQQQRDEQIVDTVDESSKQVKGLFPWNW